MKRWLNDFWFYHSEVVIAILLFATVMVTAVFGLGLLEANKYKYNCDLNERPTIHTAFMIDDTQYAYDPKGFCDKLKEKMVQE